MKAASNFCTGAVVDYSRSSSGGSGGSGSSSGSFSSSFNVGRHMHISDAAEDTAIYMHMPARFRPFLLRVLNWKDKVVKLTS
jgi:hypothetical protein